MDEHEATAYAAEMNFQLWKEELARRQSCEAECIDLSTKLAAAERELATVGARLEVVKRLSLTADDLEMHQLRELVGRIAAAAGLAARVR